MAGTRKKILDRLNTPRAVRWLWIVVAAPFALLVFLLILTALGLFGTLPSFEELENPKSNLATEIYSDDGQMIGSFFVENRSYVDYGELNDSLVWALVSVEDMRFYSHSGIDFVSLARVAFKTVAMGDRSQGGGSTITQQLAKNLFPRDARVYGSTFSRMGKFVGFKLKEWITAVKLEYNYTKEEIIAMYLNTVEYGSNAFGIKSAAQTFFNKMPADLTINEAAMLVGVVNAPTKYSPRFNPGQALARRNVVLRRMEACGFIDEPQYDSLAALPIVLNYRPISHNYGTGTYFRQMLRNVMTMPRPERSDFRNADPRREEWDYQQAAKRWEGNPLYGWVHKNLKPDGSRYNLSTDGLKIYTTINASMQEYAEKAVQSTMENSVQPRMNDQIRWSRTIFQDRTPAQVEAIITGAIRLSDRYRAMKNDGASDAEIERVFNTPVQTRVFTYKGEVDTLITPRDSIIHHKKILRASFVAIDPAAGHLKAYVGGPNFLYFKYDNASQGKRQVGSTMKPFVYTFAFDQLGYDPCTMVPNSPTIIETVNGEPWQPQEAGGNPNIYDHELKPLWWGLANSRNNYSAWVMKQAKQPSAVADFIHRMGIQSYIDPVDALCLGTPDLTLYELVAAYTTFVNGGVFTDPIFVTRIEDRHGNLISTFAPVSSDAIGERTAYTMIQMMRRVVDMGTAGRLRSGNFGFTGQMAGKTGTSQDNRDAWFVGVLPRLVAGAWVGGEDQSVHLSLGGEGSQIAMPIYGDFLKMVYADPRLGIRATDVFYRPEGAAEIECAKTGGGDGETPPDGQAAFDDEFFD